MNRPDEAAEFERWLDRELPRAVAAELDASAPPPPLAIPSRSLARRGGAALRLRGAAALVAIGLAIVGGAALATGSPNPLSWGHRMIHAVTAGALVLQRTPAPTPDPPPPARPVTRAAGADTQPQRTAGDTGVAGADPAGGNQGAARPGHPAGSPPPDQGRPPDDHGHQQGQSRQP